MKRRNDHYAGGLLIAIALLGLLVTGCGTGGGAKVQGDSPQDVFDTMKQSMQDQDFETFAHCLTPNSQKKMAATLVVAGGMIIAFSQMGQQMGDEGEAEPDNSAMEKFQNILKDHGIDEKTMQQPPPNAENMSQNEVIMAMGEKIEDRPGFIAEVMQLMTEISEKEDGSVSNNMALSADATLGDLEVDDDTASGTLTYPMNGEEKTEPIEFKKIDGQWRIELPDQQASGPAPGPPPGMNNEVEMDLDVGGGEMDIQVDPNSQQGPGVDFEIETDTGNGNGKTETEGFQLEVETGADDNGS